MDAATVGRLVGLALVLDAGTDATFALLALVVFVAAADTAAHYEAALRKGGGRPSSAGPAGPSSGAPAAAAAPPPPITWVPLITAAPGLWEDGDGLAAAEAAIVDAVTAAGPPDTVCLVLDSLAALRDAARSPGAWRAFLASPALLACPAAAVLARADADAAGAEDGDGGGAGAAARWLPSLAAAASLILTAAPLPSGAAAGVDGTLTLARLSAAAAAAAAGASAAGDGGGRAVPGRSPLAGAVFQFGALPAGGVRVEVRR